MRYLRKASFFRKMIRRWQSGVAVYEPLVFAPLTIIAVTGSLVVAKNANDLVTYGTQGQFNNTISNYVAATLAQNCRYVLAGQNIGPLNNLSYTVGGVTTQLASTDPSAPASQLVKSIVFEAGPLQGAGVHLGELKIAFHQPGTNSAGQQNEKLVEYPIFYRHVAGLINDCALLRDNQKYSTNMFIGLTSDTPIKYVMTIAQGYMMCVAMQLTYEVCYGHRGFVTTTPPPATVTPTVPLLFPLPVSGPTLAAHTPKGPVILPYTNPEDIVSTVTTVTTIDADADAKSGDSKTSPSKMMTR